MDKVAVKNQKRRSHLQEAPRKQSTATGSPSIGALDQEISDFVQKGNDSSHTTNTNSTMDTSSSSISSHHRPHAPNRRSSFEGEMVSNKQMERTSESKLKRMSAASATGLEPSASSSSPLLQVSKASANASMSEFVNARFDNIGQQHNKSATRKSVEFPSSRPAPPKRTGSLKVPVLVKSQFKDEEEDEKEMLAAWSRNTPRRASSSSGKHDFQGKKLKKKRVTLKRASVNQVADSQLFDWARDGSKSRSSRRSLSQVQEPQEGRQPLSRSGSFKLPITLKSKSINGGDEYTLGMQKNKPQSRSSGSLHAMLTASSDKGGDGKGSRARNCDMSVGSNRVSLASALTERRNYVDDNNDVIHDWVRKSDETVVTMTTVTSMNAAALQKRQQQKQEEHASGNNSPTVQIEGSKEVVGDQNHAIPPESFHSEMPPSWEDMDWMLNNSNRSNASNCIPRRSSEGALDVLGRATRKNKNKVSATTPKQRITKTSSSSSSKRSKQDSARGSTLKRGDSDHKSSKGSSSKDRVKSESDSKRSTRSNTKENSSSKSDAGSSKEATRAGSVLKKSSSTRDKERKRDSEKERKRKSDKDRKKDKDKKSSRKREHSDRTRGRVRSESPSRMRSGRSRSRGVRKTVCSESPTRRRLRRSSRAAARSQSPTRVTTVAGEPSSPRRAQKRLTRDVANSLSRAPPEMLINNDSVSRRRSTVSDDSSHSLSLAQAAALACQPQGESSRPRHRRSFDSADEFGDDEFRNESFSAKCHHLSMAF